MRKILNIVIALLITTGANAQNRQVLNIDTCYTLARQQYPLTKERGLIEKTRYYTIENANKAYLPQLTFNGQATYQSAVTEIPIKLPGVNLSSFNKDQYKIYGEISQLIYDGGMITNQKKADDANAAIQQQNLEVSLYALRDRINQIYFGILLLNEQLNQNILLQKDIKNSIDKMRSAVKNGAALPSKLSELEVELLQQQQNRIQLVANRRSYLDMLGLFINSSLDDSIHLIVPLKLNIPNSINRPELVLYEYQKKELQIQDKILKASNMPRLSFFFQGGYGRPALNVLSNSFDFYYIGGLRFSWPIGGFYTLKNQRQMLEIQKLETDVQKEAFLFNTSLSMKQEMIEITRLQETINRDEEIIRKRTEVKEASMIQLEQGSITVYEYIGELDAEEQARLNMLLHRVQLLMTQYNYNNTSGN